MTCDICGTSFKHGNRQSVVAEKKGVLIHQLCHKCHVLKHESMNDPFLENKLCKICLVSTPPSTRGPERLARMFQI